MNHFSKIRRWRVRRSSKSEFASLTDHCKRSSDRSIWDQNSSTERTSYRSVRYNQREWGSAIVHYYLPYHFVLFDHAFSPDFPIVTMGSISSCSRRLHSRRAEDDLPVHYERKALPLMKQKKQTLKNMTTANNTNNTADNDNNC